MRYHLKDLNVIVTYVFNTNSTQKSKTYTSIIESKHFIRDNILSGTHSEKIETQGTNNDYYQKEE